MNRTFTKQLVLIAAGITLMHGSAWANTLAAKADIKFKGSSTLHDFEGVAATSPFVATFQEQEEDGELTVSAKTFIDVGNMTTNNKKRDKNMFKMFDLEHFARIEGELAETVVSETEKAEAKLHLKICDEEHDVTAIISEVQRSENQITCNMAFPVSLKAFHLKGPSVLGMIRVDDTVYVECTIVGQIGKTVAGN